MILAIVDDVIFRGKLEAGCTMVLPRSAFVQQLPELLSR